MHKENAQLEQGSSFQAEETLDLTLQIKLKGMQLRTPCKHLFCLNTHPQHVGRIKRSKHFSLKVVMLHIKLKEMKHRAQCEHIFCPYTHPQPLRCVLKSEYGHVAYQIKG